MSVFAGPEISQSGLVFAFDIGNTNKSWKGAPITNEAKNASNQIDWVIGNLDQAVSLSTIVPNESYYISSSSLTGTSFRIYFTNAALTNGATYTVSYKYRIISGGPLFFANDWCDTGITRVTTDLGAGVFYETATGTRATYDVTYRFLDLQISNNTVVQIWDLQLELGSFATPYSSKRIRSSTETILDLVNTYTLTPTGLVYNSDGSFSFNGSSYIDLNSSNIITGTNPFTVESWYTTTGTTADEIFGNYGSGSTANTLWISGRYGVYISGTVYFPGSPLGAGTYHLAASRDTSGNVVLYRNGIQVNSGVLSASIPVTYNFRMGADVNGAGEPFTGKIHRVNVFNRVLTASEIQQNFNALRGRFGI